MIHVYTGGFEYGIHNFYSRKFSQVEYKIGNASYVEKENKCKEKLKLRNDVIIDHLNQHTHAPNQTRCEVLRVKSRMRRKSERIQETTRQMLTAELGNCQGMLLPPHKLHMKKDSIPWSSGGIYYRSRISVHLRMIAALAFDPVGFVVNAFEELSDEKIQRTARLCFGVPGDDNRTINCKWPYI